MHPSTDVTQNVPTTLLLCKDILLAYNHCPGIWYANQACCNQTTYSEVL